MSCVSLPLLTIFRCLSLFSFFISSRCVCVCVINYPFTPLFMSPVFPLVWGPLLYVMCSFRRPGPSRFLFLGVCQGILWARRGATLNLLFWLGGASAMLCLCLQSAPECPRLPSTRLYQPLLPPRIFFFWGGGAMAPQAPRSTVGPGTGTALEAFCPRTLPLEASRDSCLLRVG